MQKRLASYPVNGIMIAAVVTCGSIRCGRPPRTRARRMSLQFRRWPHTEPALQRTASGLRKRGPVGTWVIVGEPRMGVADIWPLSSNSAGTEINPGAFSRDGRIP